MTAYTLRRRFIRVLPGKVQNWLWLHTWFGVLAIWQARTIAKEANINGVGIIQVVEERLQELEQTIERLKAGKSSSFKIYCSEALRSNTSLPEMLPVLAPRELDDFQRVHQVFVQRALLVHSLQRQKRAIFIIRAWRYVHIPLACLALVIISYHSFIEMAKFYSVH